MPSHTVRTWLFAGLICGAYAPAFGSGTVPKPPQSEFATSIRQYHLTADRVAAANSGGATHRPGVAGRISLGSISTAASATAGVVIDQTWDDWQYNIKGRRVDFGSLPYIHFAYTDRQGYPDGVEKFGYNVYDAIRGSWPKGQLVGCSPQIGEDSGQDVTMAVTPKNRVVLAGRDNAVGDLPYGTDNHFYFQPSTPFSCTFGAGSVIDWRQYMEGMVLFNRLSRLVDPVVEVQYWGGDTVVHVLARQSEPWWWTLSPLVNDVVIQYYRKLTFGNSGTWIGPIVTDTVNSFGYHLTASRVSPKVAYVYLRHRPDAYTHNEGCDVDLFYRESDSMGVWWKPAVNVTNADRQVDSYAPWIEVHGLYDSNDKLHIIYNAAPVPANPYDIWHDWLSLYNGSSIFHWSTATGMSTMVHRAEWDQSWMRWQLCGLLGWNAMTTAFMSITECANRLYVTWAMANDGDANPPISSDCVTRYVHDWRFAGNGEIFMAVSNDLTGLTWDRYRNLTNTHSFWCDWSGLGGLCLNDSRPAASRYGMNVNSYDTGGVPVNLIWPDTGFNPGPGPYTGDNYFHLFWIEDHWPDNYNMYWTDWDQVHAPATLNDLKWARVACVEPVVAAQIHFAPKAIGYPDWVKHQKADTTIVTVTNDGNATLSVGGIGFKKFSQTGVDWLGTSANELHISYGVGNTATFSVIINKNGIINSPGTIMSLNGEVYLKSNAPSPDDSVTISIVNFLVADTVVGQVWDTVSTACTRLVVSNNCDVGRLGAGTVNLDYMASGSECDSSATVYAYTGGLIAIRRSEGNYLYSNAYGQGVFTTEQAFKPYAMGQGASSIAGPGYDGFYTGTFVNKDTTIGIRRTYYAPTVGTDTCNFIIQRSQFFGIGGAKNNVTLGEIMDWDIPTFHNRNNDGRVLQSKNTVYQQGLDTSWTRCIKYTNRFGSIAFLGMHTAGQFHYDICANDAAFYGAYLVMKDTLAKYDTLTNSQEGYYYWTSMRTYSGLTPAQTQGSDLLTVMTYKHDFTLDTLTVYTALISIKNGDTTVLKSGIDKAKSWYYAHLRHCPMGTCCDDNSSDGRTGNVDADPAKGVDISDLSKLIDYLYISYVPPVCMLSANTDGDSYNQVDIADLSALIDYLYISFTPTAVCH
jgi:hypothetical protein